MTARSMSLRLRLLLLILTPLLLVSVLLGWWRFTVAQSTAEDLFDRGLLAAALAISRDVAISEGDALSPRTRALISDAGGGEVFYHVTGPGGIYVTGYAYPPSSRVSAGGDGPHYMIAEYRDEPVRVLRMSETTTIGNLTGKTVVTAWQRIREREAFANALARRAAALILALMATLAVVVWFGVQMGLRPLNSLHDAIQQRSPDDLHRIRRAVPAEVSGIVKTLNRLLGEVDHSIKAHQAFISDAAHQLRNPAAALLSLAETLPDVRDPGERARREQELIGAARKSARLAEQLLSLERLRYGRQLGNDSFDLNEIAETLCADLGAKVLSRDLDFGFERTGGALPVRGDAVLLGEAITNLIENAMQHGGPMLTGISVRTARSETDARIQVRDDGRGLSPGDSETVFRRFGQLTPGDGTGLGLSIVSEVARMHGGTVRIEPSDRGAHLTLSLPLSRLAGPGDQATPDRGPAQVN
ncbi:sensor histidine kinase [Microbulbifer sp. S227A]|uniref:sensor histidine kinase n=1 Tax=Microbulbifer sp. S227A TaxID=3415131 RepID=UPI003C7E8B9D